MAFHEDEIELQIVLAKLQKAFHVGVGQRDSDEEADVEFKVVQLLGDVPGIGVVVEIIIVGFVEDERVREFFLIVFAIGQ